MTRITRIESQVSDTGSVSWLSIRVIRVNRGSILLRGVVMTWLGLFTLTLPLGVHAEAPAKPLNVVLILADDLGWADLGCYGSRYHKTPHLDRLATQGIRFWDAYAACPVCSPTRAAIMTG